MTLSGI